jgi:hypothetical protein
VRLAVGTFPRLRLWRGGGEAGNDFRSFRSGREKKRAVAAISERFCREAEASANARSPVLPRKKKIDGSTL